MLTQLPQLAHESDHVLMWWIPYTDTVQLLESNRTARGVEYDGAAGQQQCAGGQEEKEGGVWGSYARMLAAWLRPLRPFLGRLQVSVRSELNDWSPARCGALKTKMNPALFQSHDTP